MPEKLKKPVEQPAEEQKRNFGEDTMTLLGDITAHERKQCVREIWESRRKCRDGDGKITSAVRVDVFRDAGKVEGVAVYEVNDGKVFSSRFDSSLNPIATASRSRMAGEHQKNISSFMRGEFFEHAMEIQEEPVTMTIQAKSGRDRDTYIWLPKKTASKMHVHDRMCVKWEQEGECLVMTPLSEATTQVKIGLFDGGVLGMTVPVDMLAASGLKPGTYAAWSEEGSSLLLRRVDKEVPNARKIHPHGNGAWVDVPDGIAKKYGIEIGMYGLWSFCDEGLCMEPRRDDPHINRILKVWANWPSQYRFMASFPFGFWENAKKWDEVFIEVKDDRLYVRKKQG